MKLPKVAHVARDNASEEQRAQCRLDLQERRDTAGCGFAVMDNGRISARSILCPALPRLATPSADLRRCMSPP